MKVKELIEKLQELDQEKEITIYDNDWGCDCDLTDIIEMVAIKRRTRYSINSNWSEWSMCYSEKKFSKECNEVYERELIDEPGYYRILFV